MSFRQRFRTLFRRRDVEAEMAEEMRFHLDQRAADYAGEGLPPEEARLAAQRKFGNLVSLQVQAREAFGWGWLERFLKDLRFAVRQLFRAPGYSLLAVATLGLGIGANTSMFCMVNGIMLKPLPYPDLDRLQTIYRTTPQNPEGGLSPADYLALRRAREPYGDFAAIALERVSLSDPGQPAQLAFAARASTNLFNLLGVQLPLGRDFLPDEEAAGRHQVVILSQRTWRNRYGAAPDILGRKIRIDGELHEVVGVLPQEFNDWRHLGNIDFFRPFAMTPDFAADRKSTNLQVFGRWHAPITPAGAATFVTAFGQKLAAAHPEYHAGSAWRVVSLQSTAIGTGGGFVLTMLIGLSGFVLLIACTNLANLLLARTMTRAREFAIRGALGASRLQLIRPLLAEALLLSLAGGFLAILTAYWFRNWAAVRSTGDNGEHVWFEVDWSVMGWAFGASLATAVAFGLAPALFAFRLDLNDTLALPGGTYGDDRKVEAFQRLALESLAALPGVDSVALAQAAPFFHWTDVRKFILADRERPPPGREPVAMVNGVSPAYFETFGMRVVAGRTFLERDNAGAPRVYLIGQSTARAWFGDADPIGRRIAQADDAGDPAWGEIVGIIADFQTVDPDPNPVVHHVYQPLAQEPLRQFEFAVRAAPEVTPTALVDDIRHTIAKLDADLPVRRLKPADQNIDRTLYQLGVLRDVLGSFGVLGLGLASLGIYGIIARTMAQRSGEFAVRLAVGAQAADIKRLVLGAGVRQALLGASLGLLGAFGVTEVISHAFPGIRANSPLVLAGTALVLVGVALLACWLPARRAGRIDAMAVLRAE